MPYIINGEPTSWKDSLYDRETFEYKYPEGLDLKPDSDFHKKLRHKIWNRAFESRAELSKRFSSWNDIDRVLTTYITLDDKEKLEKDKDSRKPVSIVFPYSYSMLEALLTYMSLAFFQTPMFQYEAVEAGDTEGAMLMEMLINLHTIKSKVALSLHTVIRDSFAYGVGIGVPGWKRTYGKIPIKTEIITQSNLGESSEKGVEFVDSLIFEGNDLSNVDPYMWLPDPTVSSDNVQDGEFLGWIGNDNFLNLLSEEGEEDSGLFNVKYLKKKKDKRSALNVDQSARHDKFGGSPNQARGITAATNPVDTINMYITLIPKEWELSESERPEKWFFKLASDDIIISAHKADHHHGLYPMAVASPEFDGYSITPNGRMEILAGLQGTLDFLFNSHIANVRKAINDMFVVDPYLINIKDLEDPQPGKLIRLNKPAWGHGVDKVVQQLNVTDITRTNIADSAYITGWMDRISGADQSMQGQQRQGGPERLTKGEFQGTRGSAVSRLQRLAQIIGMQFMQDIGTMFAVHTQQFMSQDTYVKVTGKYAEQLSSSFGNKSRAKVTPYDLAIATDLIVRDGSIPGGNFSDIWLPLYKIIATDPALRQKYDHFRIFELIAKESGAKNIEDFRVVGTNTMNDEDVLNEVSKGNMVSTDEVGV